MKRVEQIQYQGASAVTGAWQGTDPVKLYEEGGKLWMIVACLTDPAIS